VDVPALAESLGISGRLLVTTDGPDRPQVSDSELNLIYNACDVGLNTARAEGFGLVSFEHAATGAAQIVPSVGACAELWEGVASLLPLEPTPEHVAAALSALYDDRALLAERSRRAYEHATADRFSWSTIAGQWESLLLE
jgi:glycosyltransferase involved in cell wall biosynthesis